MSKTITTLRERFGRSYTFDSSGCWLWTASIAGRGYGQIWDNDLKRPERAHLVAFRLFKGNIPPGMVVRHTCDVRRCVNPEHLLLGTPQDNVDDAVSRGRHQRGERQGSAKLSEAQAASIVYDQRPASIIAAEYGVSQSTVYYIRRGKRWKHVQESAE